MPDVPVLVIKAGRGVGNPKAPVVVGMIQSLHRMVDETPEWFEQFDNLVMDEAHHAHSETWQKVANACKNAARRLGLSGTMGTSNVVNDLRVEGVLGPTYIVTNTAEMADQGYLARPIVRILRANPASYPKYEDVRQAVAPNWRQDPRGILGTLGGELYRVTYERGIIENRERNKIVIATSIRHAEQGDRFLVLCNRVPHAISLGSRIESLTTKPVWVLSGESEASLRASVLQQFKAQTKGGILIATPFFREGVDLPEVDSGFMAGGGASDTAVWQGFCRMLTTRKGKTHAIVYDVEDKGADPHEKDYLDNNFEDRLALYVRHGCKIERVK
jgi:superfamily II DNA or RNA helicase